VVDYSDGLNPTPNPRPTSPKPKPNPTNLNPNSNPNLRGIVGQYRGAYSAPPGH